MASRENIEDICREIYNDNNIMKDIMGEECSSSLVLMCKTWGACQFCSPCRKLFLEVWFLLFFSPTVSSKHLFKNDHTKHLCPCWDNHSATKVYCQVPQRTCCLKYLHQFSEICSLVIYPFIDENRDIFTYNTITLCCVTIVSQLNLYNAWSFLFGNKENSSFKRIII